MVTWEFVNIFFNDEKKKRGFLFFEFTSTAEGCP